MNLYLLTWPISHTGFDEILSAVVFASDPDQALRWLRQEKPARTGHPYGDVPKAPPQSAVIITRDEERRRGEVISVETAWA